MYHFPLTIKNKTIEIGYQGHSKWVPSSIVAKPKVIGDFHIFLTFQARINFGEFKKYRNGKFKLCAVLPSGRIQIIRFLSRNSIVHDPSALETYVPYPAPMFFLDFASWKMETEIAYPIPDNLKEEAVKAAVIHLKNMQYALDAHIDYWDAEGRPPLSMLSTEEVLEKYGKNSRSTE